MDNEGPGQTNSVSYNGDLQTYLMVIYHLSPPQNGETIYICLCLYMYISEIFMSNKEAVRTDGPVLFLAAPLRPQPNSPISLSSSCIFETERFLTQSQFSTLELLAGNREAKGTI